MAQIAARDAPTATTDRDETLRSVIAAQKEKWGRALVLLTHHYQRKEIVPFGDFLGDSYYLSKMAAEQEEAEHIVFCGVKFMAESARILCAPHQRVYLPNIHAGCPMADMAAGDDVMDAWDTLTDWCDGHTLVPISYMNSTAELKAFVGNHGGIICTSSNAERAFRWADRRGDKIFFFPDQHLGRNTANRLGIPREQVAVWSWREPPTDPEPFRRAKVILWEGYCHVHTNFTYDHTQAVRKADPNALIVVHPECNEQVVDAADAVGSTSFIVKFVDEAPPGSVIAVGTEINLISRLADEHPDKTIFELSGQTCPLCVNMYRTTLDDLAHNLTHIGEHNEVTVPDNIIAGAKLSLGRMLEL